MARGSDRLPMPGTYFQLALREFGGSAAARAAVCEGTGIDPERPLAEIELAQQLRQLDNLDRLLPAGWALQLGRRLDVAAHGPLGFAAISAPSLEQSLQVIERFAHVRSPYFRCAARRETRRFVIEIEEQVALTDAQRITLTETLLSALQALIESVLGRPMAEATLHLPYPRPPHADAYPEFLHGSLRFGAPRAAIALPVAWLRLACPMADPAMYESSLRELAAQADRLRGETYSLARVEQVIAARRDGVPSLAEVAATLHVSGRTLIRRLRRAGTTFQDLADARRRALAETLLAEPSLGVAEVSHRLGYGDPANFGRACRRWFGMPPGRYRRQRRDERS